MRVSFAALPGSSLTRISAAMSFSLERDEELCRERGVAEWRDSGLLGDRERDRREPWPLLGVRDMRGAGELFSEAA
jgi:hypothetical protein